MRRCSLPHLVQTSTPIATSRSSWIALSATARTRATALAHGVGASRPSPVRLAAPIYPPPSSGSRAIAWIQQRRIRRRRRTRRLCFRPTGGVLAGRALAGVQLIEAPAILSGSPREPRPIARWLDRAASDNRFERAQESHYLAQAEVFVSSSQSCATGELRNDLVDAPCSRSVRERQSRVGALVMGGGHGHETLGSLANATAATKTARPLAGPAMSGPSASSSPVRSRSRARPEQPCCLGTPASFKDRVARARSSSASCRRPVATLPIVAIAASTADPSVSASLAVQQADHPPVPQAGAMSGMPLFDATGRRRSPATMPGYHAGREPPNKGRTYPT
jgi:hypothetical protein